ncbi:MAG: hypothetical protein HOJ62_07070 [Planctomycetaceae bacterium]|jgi:hypothetical protein|nr:hypothetical protein [Planctomycetaceae bacterium]
MQQIHPYFLRSDCALDLESVPATVPAAQGLGLRWLPIYLGMILLGGSWPLVATAQHDKLAISTTNPNSVLLLRNGQTFTGTITRSQGIQAHYTLIDTLGNRLRFPHDQVEFVSDSILEIYAYRRATQVRTSAHSCLALAQWCMHLRLFDQAQQQIDNAISIDGRSATITRLEVRLNLLRSPPVRQAAPSNGRVASTNIVSADQVQQRINEFPAGVVYHFTHSVQPLLLNRCALAACHGPNPKSSFVLFRTSAKRIIPQRISLRNLYNTLATLDLVQPENSSLLKAATTVHGPQNQPTLGVDESEIIASLVDWVRVVATTPHPLVATPVKPDVPQQPIMYQHRNFQDAEQQIPPNTEPTPLNPSSLPNGLQQWIQSQQPQRTRSALGLGIILPIEMQGPTLGTMKISPPQRVNLTPDVGGNFSLPSSRLLQRTR